MGKRRKKQVNPRDNYLKITYGITLEDYNKKLEAQKHCCALCEKHKSEFSRSLAVDHNHKTGRIRGLLCFYCNKFRVGRHTMESARRLFAYMKRFDSK